ncbi:endonuclease/exonuclease/phosphatase family protein [Rubrivirga sp. S365]|uniref:Endonuclease/exonuclease/phosphatase family protein n=1 Tax=Rubrivirga litoralis TaxID=3075598 RepID=A0ABU3BS55_9BACT|nr:MULTISPECIES: endonuclease/exonuclease/phosphatase family protein [unclassified Rubrivirga]MDT0632128.1 endonuclease/exonuclease/phosphatase family protein [Rubrivirga sp. F394]MDT7857019.1 endonuclease/exonuclease/phosphatase family protein [Rubrivirga sp. S365]
MTVRRPALVLAALAGLLALGACGTARPDRPQDGAATDAAVRVMSFNLRLHLASDSANAWPHRRDAAAAIVGGADLAGVQEATPAMLDDLDARLPGFARIGVGREADGGGEQSALLYRADRFEVLDSGTFWLSPTPDVPGSVGWDAALPRIATWARLRDRRGGAALVAVNTHFDHVGETARRESARLLVERARALAGDGPLVVTGDVNAADTSAVYRTLTADFRDARLVSEAPATGPTATWTDFGRATDDRRIDFVFVSGPVRVLRAATDDRTIGDVAGTDSRRLPSDHTPVTATLVLDAP